jgi:hypothetical protein
MTHPGKAFSILLRWPINAGIKSQVESQVMTQVDTALNAAHLVAGSNKIVFYI